MTNALSDTTAFGQLHNPSRGRKAIYGTMLYYVKMSRSGKESAGPN